MRGQEIGDSDEQEESQTVVLLSFESISIEHSSRLHSFYDVNAMESKRKSERFARQNDLFCGMIQQETQDVFIRYRSLTP